MAQEKLGAYQPLALSLLRIAVGFTFSEHGLQKLFGMFGGMGGRGAAAHLMSLLGAAGAIETAGGLLILIGLLTRPVAFVLSGEMAVAYFMQHARRSPWPIVSGGELAVLYCFIFLLFLTAGPGPVSLDRLLHKR